MDGANHPGLLIAFDGLGGSGKSTLVRRLVAWLEASEIPTLVTREPGGTDLGEQLRSLLLARTSAPTPWAEAFLFEADRAQSYAEIVIPALSAGKVVVSDRSIYGTIAYQVFGRHLDLALVDQMSQAATRGHRPDLVFVLDIDPVASLRRRRRLGVEDRFDDEGLAYQRRVREGYAFAARRDADHSRVLDATLRPDAIFAEVLTHLAEPLADRLEARGTAGS